MYEYRKLSTAQRQQLVSERLALGYPPHQPPHLQLDQNLYLLTATCYEHQHHLKTPSRRDTLLDSLFAQFIEQGMEIHAWAILTNHYHLLIHVTAFDALRPIFQKVHGRTAFSWNGEENCRGRKIWYRYSDRLIRSERHYCATLNYIHYNPVKHGLATSPYHWRWSSVHWYLEHHGRQWLRDLWRRYPIRDYGKGWDDL